jgi:hypothetical protein
MKMQSRWALAAALVASSLAGFGVKTLLADGIPATNPLYYSGTLTEAGQPVTGQRDITINLWPDATSNGTPLCQTVVTAAPIVDGRFRIALASPCKTVLNQNSGAWVEVIDGTTSIGRSKIGAVPYAVEADHAMSATNAAGALATQLVPSGAVMAFNLAACPAGWAPFTAAGGRTIVGVNGAGGNGLSQRTLGQTLGEENHSMSASEMPSHTHNILIQSPGSGPNQGYWNFNWGTAGAFGSQAAIPPTYGAGLQNFMVAEAAGGGTAFNNMQPSVALLYCQKQ